MHDFEIPYLIYQGDYSLMRVKIRLIFVSFRLQQIWQHLVHFGGSLDGVPQSITDVRPFSVRVILSLVEGSAFCSLRHVTDVCATYSAM